MNLMLKGLSALAISLGAATTFAAPAYLTTHNRTGEESNAYIPGSIPSLYPTAAYSTNQVYWNLVRLACYGHTTNGQCPALIKMATNTANPIDIGYVTMDLNTGDITPKTLSAKGYSLRVIGPGEAEITKN
ncbi:TPA: hypothetical protein VAH64_000252 [Legionella pneumophila]|nr:hypothetical protein [Legionella pneumophila]